MSGEEILSRAHIASEYRRLGHTRGWRFLTCPERNLQTARVALVTINPGGDQYLDPQYSCEKGNAYVVEAWPNFIAGSHPLQVQVRRMFSEMDVEINDVLSGYLVPFRSARWADLPRQDESLRLGEVLWRKVFQVSPAKLVVAFGTLTGDELVKILKANFQSCHKAAWGSMNFRVYSFGEGGSIIVLPHLSRFRIFSRPQSIAAFRQALSAARSFTDM